MTNENAIIEIKMLIEYFNKLGIKRVNALEKAIEALEEGRIKPGCSEEEYTTIRESIK